MMSHKNSMQSKPFQMPDEITRPAWGYIIVSFIALCIGLVRAHALIKVISNVMYANIFCITGVALFIGILGLYVSKLKTATALGESRN
jgi:hypothetical protein